MAFCEHQLIKLNILKKEIFWYLFKNWNEKTIIIIMAIKTKLPIFIYSEEEETETVDTLSQSRV